MQASFPVTRRHSGKGPLFLLVMIIALSAYAHTWNPTGFPVFHVDETIYVKRGAGILNNEVLYDLHAEKGHPVNVADSEILNNRTPYQYDHPFLGQMVIAGFMHVTGYQNLLDDPSTDPSHLEALYAYPRAFMGLLAALDTLLVYLIADRMFGRRVAAVAAVIFAVAPMSLMLRMVLLDSILLPFVLSSVLLALYSRGPGDRKRHLLLLASGACLGLAIFTKVPAVAMIPPGAILAYWASRRIRGVGLWLAPVLAIPAVWPAYAAQAGQFDLWLRDAAWQAGRSNGGLPEAAGLLFKYDPVLISLGMAGFAFAVICLVLRPGGRRRDTRTRGGPSHDPPPARHQVPGGAVSADLDVEPRVAGSGNLGFLAAWFSSILLFFGAIGFVSYFHLSMLLPALCIAAAVLILRGGGWLSRGTGRSLAGDRAALIAVLAIGLAGLSTTGVILHFATQSPEFEAASFLLRNYSDDPNTVKVVSPASQWLLRDVHGMQNTTRFYLAAKAGYGESIRPGHGLQNTAGFPDHYVRPDAERMILAFDHYDKKFYADAADACDYAADSASEDCHGAYRMMRLFNESGLIKEFGNGVPAGAFSSLPPHIERHLTNPYSITEWLPAKESGGR